MSWRVLHCSVQEPAGAHTQHHEAEDGGHPFCPALHLGSPCQTAPCQVPAISEQQKLGAAYSSGGLPGAKKGRALFSAGSRHQGGALGGQGGDGEGSRSALPSIRLASPPSCHLLVSPSHLRSLYQTGRGAAGVLPPPPAALCEGDALPGDAVEMNERLLSTAVPCCCPTTSSHTGSGQGAPGCL